MYPLLLKEKRTDIKYGFECFAIFFSKHAHDRSLTTLAFGAGWLRLFWHFFLLLSKNFGMNSKSRDNYMFFDKRVCSSMLGTAINLGFKMSCLLEKRKKKNNNNNDK